MPHLLFTDATESAFRTMARALDLGHRVTFLQGEQFRLYVLTEWITDVIGRVDRLITMPVTSDADVLTAVIGRVHAEDPVDAVIGQLELTVEATAIACERLGLRFTSAVGVRNARNKARARQLIEAAGLSSTRFAVVQDADSVVEATERFGCPVIIKLLSGTDSIMAYRADSATAARAAATEILAQIRDLAPQVREQFSRGILVEEYVSGELVSAELGLLNGTSYRFMVTGRALSDANECVEMGAVLPANIPDSLADTCFEYAEAVCRVLGLDLGIFHIEMMLSERGPVLIEANPRLMGGVMTTLYEILTGRSISEDVIDIHLGLPIRGELPTPSAFVTARKVMPLVAGRLPKQLDLSWLDGVDDGLVHFVNYRLSPGAGVGRMQVLARAAVSAPTWKQAMAQADALIGRFETTLGLPLAKTSPQRPTHAPH